MSIPLCPYFGSCGGCTAQHIDYEVQLENKRSLISNSIKYPDVKIFSGSSYHYRNRMDFLFHQKGLGLRKKNEHNAIVDIESCAIANEKINALLKEVRQSFKDADAFNPKKKTGALWYAVIRAPGNVSSVSFVVNEDSTKLRDAVEKIEEFSKATSADNVVTIYVPSSSEASTSEESYPVKGTEELEESYMGMKFFHNVQGFFQNNHEVAGKMVEYCNSIFKKYETKDCHLLDLYGGVGAFGITNASIFKEVTIIDSWKKSIESAEKNIEANSAKNAKALALNAKKLKKIQFPGRLFVVADPPRSGMDMETIQRLNELKPEAIVYISCNPVQLAKDIPKFKKYSINSAAVFDMFPHTPHIEAVVELKLNS